MMKPTKESIAAFEEAIAQGRLSENPEASNYAWDYMYMGTFDGKTAFKHIDTRDYLPAGKGTNK